MLIESGSGLAVASSLLPANPSENKQATPSRTAIEHDIESKIVFFMGYSPCGNRDHGQHGLSSRLEVAPIWLLSDLLINVRPE
jgi:hypothetical protein